MYRVFDKEWFSKHQSRLLRLLRFSLFRKILRIDTDKPIIKIEPNSYTVLLETNGNTWKVQTDFRTHWKYSKRLYYAFKPLWYAFHIWDMIVNPLVPQWNLGFDTLTKYPDPHVETSTFDGYVTNDRATWASARSNTDGTTSDDSISQGVLVQDRFISSSQWIVTVAFFLFDTSSLTSGVDVSAAVLSVVPHDAAGGTIVDGIDVRIVSSSPASNTSVSTADFDQVGSTVFASLAGWTVSDSTYRDFTLDSNGIANISKTGVSKFGARGSRSMDDLTPTGNNQVLCRYADYAGTTTDPKLVVTYSAPPVTFSVANPIVQGVKIVNP